MTAPRKGLWKAALLAVAACAPALAQQDTGPSVDIDAIGALPSSVDFVLAADDLARRRTSKAGEALEAFLSEMSDWDRSGAAWSDLSQALGFTRVQALDALLGQRVIIAGTGMDPAKRTEPTQFALLSNISTQTTARIRSRLKPAPRAIAEHLPILALEDGQFELATTVQSSDEARNGSARLLIAPQGSSTLFDQLLPSLNGVGAPSPLSSSAEWANLRDLGRPDLFFMLRSPKPADDQAKARSDFFGFGAFAAEDGFTGKFISTDAMLIGGLLSAHPRADAIWPTATIDALEDGSVLLVAGSPRAAAEPAPLKADSTLLLSVMGMLNLPPEVQKQIDGNAVVAVHPEEDGVTVLAALPSPDIFTLSADAIQWARSMGTVGGNWKDAHVTGKRGIWSVQVTATDHGLARDVLPRNGTLAWAFAHAHDWTEDHKEGWFVVGIRFGPAEPSELWPVVERVKDMLDAEKRTEPKEIFRLVVRPKDLIPLVRPIAPSIGASASAAVGPPDPSTPASKDPLSAVRWLDRVETRISREGPGLVEGTVGVRFNLELLEPPQPH